MEYLKAGWYINLTVAIDFTASNKNHHKILPNGELNDYELAISEVGKILAPYARKEKFFGFGFGGIPHYHPDCDEEVMHDFTLNGDLTWKEKLMKSGPDKGQTKIVEDFNAGMISGLDGLLDEYRKAVQKTTCWGPTFFSPLM